MDKSFNSNFKPLIYPLESVRRSKANRVLPYDALKILLPQDTVATLAPIRDKKSHYPATCGSTEKVEKAFYHEKAKEKRQKIIRQLKRMNNFVLFNRQRIEEYLRWTKKISQQLIEYNNQHRDPQLVKLADDLKVSQKRYDKVRDIIKTPAYCKMLSDKFITLIDANKDAETKENESKHIGRQIRAIGAKQDHLIAMIHFVTEAFRMNVTKLLLTTTDARQQKILKMLRKETATIMHSKFPMEGK